MKDFYNYETRKIRENLDIGFNIMNPFAFAYLAHFVVIKKGESIYVFEFSDS